MRMNVRIGEKAMEINSANVKEMISRCGTMLVGAFRDAFDGRVSQECEDVFDKTVELGIENTTRALIEAGVEDDAMVSALCKVWGLTRNDAVQRIAWLKRKIAAERLEEFLLLKGMRSEAVDKFYREYAVLTRLSNDDSVLELWGKPEQLYSKLKEMGADPRPAVRLVSRA